MTTVADSAFFEYFEKLAGLRRAQRIWGSIAKKRNLGGDVAEGLHGAGATAHNKLIRRAEGIGPEEYFEHQMPGAISDDIERKIRKSFPQLNEADSIRAFTALNSKPPGYPMPR